MSEPGQDNPPAARPANRLDKDEMRRLRRHRRRHRILQATSILPSLATVFNGLSGFAAIHFATKEKLGDGSLEAARNLAVAVGMIFLAMMFDMLDGRLARMTRRTSDFGAQLDSLCDMVSFGLAPAVLAAHAVIAALREALVTPNLPIERVVLCVAGVYVACAALRLARFNVENEPDESAHMSFRGLPSPGAAAALVSLVLLYTWLKTDFSPSAWTWIVVAAGISVTTLLCGLLMVSRFRYPHVVNQFIRGKRPFAYLVRLVVLLVAGVVAAVLALPVLLAVVTVVYALSGPIGAIWRLRKTPTPTA